ncbi:MAG: branched-chain amino acid transport system II carrier protein [Alphaproteobacteria bacterium]|nr:branched-chain amino acid transport system II carrier protein [Alphaproteobacteria bacterium]MBP7729399.1 branched-chain amino acid transport system II carrier protein [Alphaproteobacteria bacterium]
MLGYQCFGLTLKEILAIITGGFAVFAMFFGAGNLVFPLLAGKITHSSFLSSFAGLSLTGIIVPFLGLLGILLYEGSYQNFFDRFGKVIAFVLISLTGIMVRFLGLFGILLYQGSYQNFFDRFGKVIAFVLISFMLLLLGPFGALPRCITVAFGSFSVLAPTFPLSGFSLIMSGIVFLLCLNRNQIIPLLGAVLAPIKILSVGFILLFGLLFAHSPQPSPMSSLDAFQDGVFQGYQMMDLIAAFFFATVIARHFHLKFVENGGNKNRTFILPLYAMLLGSSLLLIVYLALVYLGATFSQDLSKHAPEQFLSVIAYLTLGNFGGRLVTIAIILSCFTTVIALTTVFTDFLYEQIFKNRLSHTLCLSLTVAITFLMSNLGFSGIVSFLMPILLYLYPLLILLTVINIATWVWEKLRPIKVRSSKT